jgi:hypothetical protein
LIWNNNNNNNNNNDDDNSTLAPALKARHFRWKQTTALALHEKWIRDVDSHFAQSCTATKPPHEAGFRYRMSILENSNLILATSPTRSANSTTQVGRLPEAFNVETRYEAPNLSRQRGAKTVHQLPGKTGA